MDIIQKTGIINELMDNQDVEQNYLWETYKTDREAMELLKQELESKASATIKLRNNRYELIIHDSTAFNRYYEDLKVRSGFYNTQEDRINYIIEKLLIDNDYVKTEDLADQLYVSQRQVSNYLKAVRNYFKRYDLELKAVPHYGLLLIGDELQRRICLAEFLSRSVTSYGRTSLNLRENEVINEIREIVTEAVEELQYPLADYVFEILIIHLFVAVARIKHGASIEFAEVENVSREDRQVADRIIAEMSRKYEVTFAESEYNYIIAHLLSKRDYRENEITITVPVEVADLVIEVVKRIDREFNRSFRSDFHLCMTLALHFLPLLHRVRFGFKLVNPMLNEIKKKYLYEYEMAEEGLQVINEKFNCRLSEDEIGYIALDLRMSIENRYDKTKERVLLVCASGKGSAELLKMQIIQYLSDFIETVELCSLREVKGRDLDSYDHIFTTVPLHVSTTTPIFFISHFLGREDINRIGSILRFGDSRETIMQYFDRNLFMGVVRVTDKNVLLRKMTTHIEKYRDIPDTFLASVLERERIANTSFGNMVAFPHPRELQTDTTFVCIAILEEPILWNDNDRIQVVLLASIEKSRNKELSEFYKAVTKLINSQENIDRLIRKPEYETLHEILINS